MGLVQPGVQSLMSRRVPPNEQGRLQGANSGIMSITGLIGPALYTSVFAWAIGSVAHLHQPGLAILLAGGLLVIASGLVLRFAKPAPAPV
jgi:DHA1 family tetracycline resistance protein-like MFS transporter